MANRFWVGANNATWDTSNTSNWATTSGGTPGASVPTSADTVIIDSFSANKTILIGNASQCQSLTISGGSVNLSGNNTGTLSVNGSLSITGAGVTYSSAKSLNIDVNFSITGSAAGSTTWTGSGSLIFNTSGTSNFTSGGTVISSSITVETTNFVLQDALTTTNSITVSQFGAIFNTSGFTLTCDSFSTGSSGTRTVNFSSSTVNLSSLTINSGGTLTYNQASQINVTSNTGDVTTFIGLTNLSYTGTGSGTRTLTVRAAGQTFTNLSVSPPSSSGIAILSLGSATASSQNFTVSGTLSISGADAQRRVGLISTGGVCTVTAPAFAPNDVDFYSITFAGGASGTSVTRGGDGGNNTNIVFPAAKTVYWNNPGTQSWYSTSWATSSGGSPSINNQPLPQDTAIIDNAGTAGTILADGAFIGTLDASARTTSMSLTLCDTLTTYVHGDLLLTSAITMPTTFNSGTLYFRKGSGTHSINTGNNVTPYNIVFDRTGSTVSLLSDLNVSTLGSITVSISGPNGINLNGRTITARTFLSNMTTTLDVGAGSVFNLHGSGTVFRNSSTTSTGTSNATINILNSGSAAITVTSSSGWTETASPNLNANLGTYSIDCSGAFNNINFVGKTSGTFTPTGAGLILYGDLAMSSGMSAGSTSVSMTFASTSTTARNVTTAGVAFDCPITFNGAGGLWLLQDAFTVGTTRTVTLSNGTLDLNGRTLTTGNFTISNGTMSIIWDGGTIVVTGGSWSLSNPISFTNTAGTGEGLISMARATGQTFSGNVTAVYAAKLRLAGAGALSISGTNTFTDMDQTAGVATTITFPSSTTTTFTRNFSVSGSLGNVITLSPSVAATVFTLSCNGMPDVSYLNLSYITVTGNLNPRWIQRNSTIGLSVTGFNTTSPRTLYWVGGTASWDGTAGTKWALTSGGTGGEAIPTLYDDVIFDSGTGGVGTVTIATATAICNNLTVSTGWTGTLAGTTASQIWGNLTLAPSMTLTYSGSITFAGGGSSRTITSAGRSIPSLFTFTGINGTWALQDALTTTSASGIVVSAGTFDTNSYAVTAVLLNSNTSTFVRGINLRASTVTLTGTSPLAMVTTNLTFDAGTSTINLSGSVTSFNPGLTSLYNVRFTNTTAQTRALSGITTFNDLYAAAPSTAGQTTITFAASTVINGTLGTIGTAGNRRVVYQSSTVGIQYTLTMNGSQTGGALVDVDFRDLIIQGTAAPLTGTRIGNRGGVSGITFSTPKTVYWNQAAGGNWSSTSWATSAGGAVSDNNFPLAQDTAVIVDTGLNSAATITLDAAILHVGTIDMSGRSIAMTLSTSVNIVRVYGNLTCSTSVTITGTGTITFSGRNTQTITSAGRTFSQGLTVDSYGGTVQLADALNMGVRTLNVTNGAFNTGNFNVTAGILSSSNSNVRTINLGSSTVTLSGTSGAISFATSTNLTFNAGTSSLVFTGGSTGTILDGGGSTFYDVSFTSTSSGITATITGNNTFRNLTFTAPASDVIIQYLFSGNNTVTGTLTCAGATPTRRLMILSDTIGTPRTFTVNTLSAQDCDFRDITIAGAAAGSSPTRAGDCGGNTGITFPAPKTVYWNLTGSQNWSATAWATLSGGTPAVNNFPLAQDTAIFDNTGAATTVTVNSNWNIGNIDMSGRSSAMTLATGTATPSIYGDWRFGTGVTPTGTGALIFSGRGIETILSNGKTFTQTIAIQNVTGTVQLADALSIGAGSALNLISGTFSAVTYNVSTPTFNSNFLTARTLNMGTGTWTLSGTGTIWNVTAPTSLTFNPGTANIVLSDTSTTARTFAGAGFSYNRLTIGGTTGISTTTITGNNQFTDLASTKTVAHTIALGTTTQSFGKWSVTGTVGNVVTLTGTGTTHVIAGAATSGIDYLAMGSIGFDAASPGEFYAGANSTGTAGAPVFRTAPPAARTLYWVGGTGNWSSTTKWSTSSGGASGAAIPTSLDNVIFNSASNATAYTATIDTPVRCNQITVAGPASGNLTLAGANPNSLIIHGNAVFPATGFTRTYTGGIILSGSTTGKTFTSGGITFSAASVSTMTINGVGCSWSMADALNLSTNAGLTLTNGTFSTNNFTLTCPYLEMDASLGGARVLNLGSSTVSMSGSANAIRFGTTITQRNLITFNAGTSNITLSTTPGTLSFNGQTFNNFTLPPGNPGTLNIDGATFNNLTFSANPNAFRMNQNINGNFTVTGTLTFTAPSQASRRTSLRSDTIGVTRTITCGAFSGTDVDFRDITITGAAAPVSGTRIGDLGGNSGITFSTPKTVYWNLAGTNNWDSNGWATTPTGTPSLNNFPLAQDTAVFTDSGAGTQVNLASSTYLPNIDASGRTSALALNFNTAPEAYGSMTFGSGITITNTSTVTFAGRGIMTYTSAGKTTTFPIDIDAVTGTFRLGDAFTSTNTLTLTSGTFAANDFNTTCATFSSTNSNTRTINMGSGTFTLTFTGTVWTFATSTNLTFNRNTSTILLSDTTTTARTFAGGGQTYNRLVIGGATGTSTTTISGNNTFAEISSTKTVAHTISLGTTTQTVGAFTVNGSAGNVVTVTGTSAASPATLVYSGASTVSVNYVNPTFVSAYPLTSTWTTAAGVNGGSLGWTFAAFVVFTAGGNFFLFF